MATPTASTQLRFDRNDRLKDPQQFNDWCMLVESILGSEDAWDILQPGYAIPAATDVVEYSVWARKNRIAKSLLPLTLDESHRHIIRGKLDVAAVAWKAIVDKFQPDTHVGRVTAVVEFLALKHDSSQSLDDFLKDYAERVRLLAKLELTLAPKFLSIHLLTTLPTDYNNLKTVLFNGEKERGDLPHPEELFQRIRDEHALHKLDTSDKHALAATSRTVNKQRPPSPCYVCNGAHWLADCPDKEGVATYRANRKKNRTQARAALAVTSSVDDLDTSDAGVFGWAAHDGPLPHGWYLDSGASHHMTGDATVFTTLQRFTTPQSIRGIGNGTVQALGTGTVSIADANSLQLHNVLYAPELKYSLASVPRILATGATVTFNGSKATIALHGRTVAEGEQVKAKLFRLVSSHGESSPVALSARVPLLTWHRRLGHLNLAAVKHFVSARSPTLVDLSTPDSCDACTACKMHRAPFPDSTSRAHAPGELLHTDVLSFPDESISGCKYLLVVVDDHSRKTWCFPLVQKSGTAQTLRTFLNTLKTNGFTVRRLRSDRGGEYLNHSLGDALRDLGITQETTVGYSPQSNGRAERVNRTIVEGVRTMLHDAGLPKKLWAEAARTFVTVKNRSPHQALPDGTTPDEVFYGTTARLPAIPPLRAFGCQAWSYIPKERRSKLDPSGTRLIFVGYDGSAAYRLYSPTSERVHVARIGEVIFDEDSFAPSLRSATSDDAATAKDTADGDDTAPNVPPAATAAGTDEPATVGAATPAVGAATPAVGAATPGVDTAASAETLGRGQRTRIPNRHFPEDDWHCYAADYVPALQEQLAIAPRPHESPFNFPGCDFLMGLAATSGVLEPTTYKAAMASPDADKWQTACQKEIDALTANKTWRLVPNDGQRTLGSKWVFKVKHGPDGAITTYKARLVVQGFSQRPGIDFAASYAPVVKFTTLRLVTAIAARNAWELHSCDIDNAYLHGEKDPADVVYMRQPESFTTGNGELCEILKPLYGLKPSALYWYRALEAKLSSMGFANTHSDRCLFLRRDTGIVTLLAVYVDDIVLTSSSPASIAAVKDELRRAFGIKDGGLASWILGIRVTTTPGGIHLGQERYILDCLTKYGLDGATPVGVPVQRDLPLHKASDNDAVTTMPFLEALGSLMYAMLATRPDIAYAVSRLSRHSAHPTAAHWNALVDVYRYLKGTSAVGISFSSSTSSDGWVPELTGYSDSAHGDDIATSRSTMGYVFLADGAALCWSSKLQSRVCRSSTEAEYLALSHACDTAVWLRQLIQELVDPSGNPDSQPPTLIYGDNVGSIALAENARDSPARRHVRITEHLVKELLDRKQIRLQFARTTSMLADLLTKGLSKARVLAFRIGCKLLPSPP